MDHSVYMIALFMEQMVNNMHIRSGQFRQHLRVHYAKEWAIQWHGPYPYEHYSHTPREVFER